MSPVVDRRLRNRTPFIAVTHLRNEGGRTIVPGHLGSCKGGLKFDANQVTVWRKLWREATVEIKP